MEGVSGLNLSHHISNSWLGAGCQWCDAVTLSHTFFLVSSLVFSNTHFLFLKFIAFVS